ncbi:MAG: hypothetical protein JST81_14225 [Bacteroidetes bacterium]|nr:hypothetical protein [Bacteroidota bacterium]
MKTLKTLFSLLLCLTTAVAFSQKSDQGKQKFFASYPESIQLSKNILQNTMNASEGEEVIVSFTSDFRFKGTVISNLKKYDNLQSVMIKSPVFGNAIFQLSRITNPDKSFSYTGRIINPEAADGYEIKKDKYDNYSFVKFETKRILQDCSF